MRDILKRFWTKVNKTDGCWLWTASGDKYGQFWVKGKYEASHRFSYELVYGKIPSGLLVCHTCDTPSCVNLSHLFLGTAKDNTRDMQNKGRGANQVGESNGCAKLTQAQITDIRSRPKYKGYQFALAKEFGVHQAHISRIINNKIWSSD